ncbi:MAG: hypothetical protein AAFQ47_04505 [Pseudomonadota bacterium]
MNKLVQGGFATVAGIALSIWATSTLANGRNDDIFRAAKKDMSQAREDAA